MPTKNECMRDRETDRQTVSDMYKEWAVHKLQSTADDVTCKRYTQQCYFRRAF